jgi:pimeloyl-ACP methyl ester carboxylesterase
LAEALSDGFQILEPFQRDPGDGPLTVERHVEDLATVMPAPAAIVGWSSGAMLALSFVVARPDLVRSLTLVGCGTYDQATRSAYRRAMNERLGPEGKREYDDLRRRLHNSTPAEYRGLRTDFVQLVQRAQSVDPIAIEEPVARTSTTASDDETWADVVRRQDEGIEPAAFAAIRAPSLMLHGDGDPHPGRATYDLLHSYIPQLELVEFPHCGHMPWRERTAREPFLDTLRKWLRSNS